MKRLILSLFCTFALATQSDLSEKTQSFYTISDSLKATLHYLDKQTGHALVIGNTFVWSCVGAAAGSTIIPVIGVGVIAAHSTLMHHNKKLAETQKLLEAQSPTPVTEKGAVKLPH